MGAILSRERWVNTLRPRQNGRRFADDTFKRIFLNENVRISIKISLKFVSKGPINNIPALVQIMAWRRSGDKPLSEPMMASLLTHICVTRPQWDKVMTWPVRCQAIVETSADFSCGPLWKLFSLNINTSNGSWCMGIKGEMSGTVCVTFTWYMYIYELFIAFVCFVVCSSL